MEIVTYKELEWYVMSENSKEKLLLMKDCFTNEMIKKYFDRYSGNFDVQFNPNYNIWWEDSYIRRILNEKFILDLNKKDLNIMKTTLKFIEEIRITNDYVRLITEEEVRKLRKMNIEILKSESNHNYWTMSPSYINHGNKYLYNVWGTNSKPGVTPGHLYGYVYDSMAGYTSGVRPVISLKNNTIPDKEFKKEFSKYLSL